MFGKAIETADWGVTPSLASFFWKESTSAESCLYETVRAGLPGTIMAVVSAAAEKEFERVVDAIVEFWAEIWIVAMYLGTYSTY